MQHVDENYLNYCNFFLALAHSMFEKSIEMLAKPRSDKRVAYTLLTKAAEMNHLEARAKLAWANVFGLHTDFVDAAKEFEELAKQGVPDAHMV